MKTYSKALAFVTVASFLSIPVFAQTQGNSANPGHLAGANEAMTMVPAKAILSRTLDANNDRSESTVEARIRDKVTLSNGTVLPTGALLLGTVAQDNMQPVGASRLALRFNQARLKDGTVIPVKATIVGLFTPGSVATDDVVGPADNLPNTWNDKTLTVDQLSVTSGVDLHSNIASDNSGVFVSTKRHDIRLKSGSELQLAIAPARNAS